jgi:hypothetical protein
MKWPTALIIAAVAAVTSCSAGTAPRPFVDRALILIINDAATIPIVSVASATAAAWLRAQNSGTAIDVSVRIAAVSEALLLLSHHRWPALTCLDRERWAPLSPTG